jgi:hypothetical protein
MEFILNERSGEVLFRDIKNEPYTYEGIDYIPGCY